VRIMKKIIIISLLLWAPIVTKPSSAQEIVNTEWEENFLTVTYSPTKGVVSCTVYSSEGAGIGGSAAMSVGGVAVVRVELPEEFVNTELRIECSSPTNGY